MVVFVLLSLCVCVVLGEHVVELNEDNFYKVVLDTNKNVFVEFYSSPTQWSRAYAPTYEKVAEIFKDEPNCVVAKLNVNVNRGLMKIYEYKGFMKFFLFPADENTDGELYSSEQRSIIELVKFLNKKCGTSRLPDGKVDEDHGRISAFDDLAEKFMKEIKTSDFAAADESTKEIGNYYVNVMKKILEKGDSYVSGEISRLENVLQGYLKLETRKNTQRRINILKFFSKAGVTEEDIVEGEAVEEDSIVNDTTDTIDESVKKDADIKKAKSKDEIILDAIMNGGDGSTGFINKNEL